MSASMKKLFCLLLVLSAAACSKDKTAPAAGGSETSGSAMAGSATAGSAMAGSGSAMAGSDMAGSAMAGSGAGSGSAAAGSGAGSGSAAWDFDKLTHEQQTDFMKKTVVPTMKPIFQKFDAKHYKDFGCKTCHGKDPKATKFKMPNPELPKLDFAALEAGKQKPEIAKWMGMVVKPEMAKILGQKEFDPKHPEMGGFGCLECHEQKK